MAVPVTPIESWEQFAAVVFEQSYDTHLGRYRSPYALRGMCGDWPLQPSLHRMGHSGNTMAMIEHVMFRNFRKYAHQEATASKSEWEWLSLAQHHGLPTRLLDWTYSPLVALHFATNELDKMDQPGVVWMVDFVEARRWMPRRLGQVLVKRAAFTFSVQMLEDEFPRIEDVERQKARAPEFVVFFEPPSLDPRIVNQFGLFSLMNRPEARLDEWLGIRASERPGFARKLVIPAEKKWELRDKLDGMNMTERVMMPGLDGLSAWLKRWYSAKVSAPGRDRHAEAPDREPLASRRKPGLRGEGRSARQPRPKRIAV